MGEFELNRTASRILGLAVMHCRTPRRELEESIP
jgi:hypothetical protein